MHEGDEVEFRAFVTTTEPRLHRALAAALGWDRGRDATADALAYAWEHWPKVRAMANPAGYLYRVGQSSVRRRKVPGAVRSARRALTGSTNRPFCGSWPICPNVNGSPSCSSTASNGPPVRCPNSRACRRPLSIPIWNGD